MTFTTCSFAMRRTNNFQLVREALLRNVRRGCGGGGRRVVATAAAAPPRSSSHVFCRHDKDSVAQEFFHGHERL